MSFTVKMKIPKGMKADDPHLEAGIATLEHDVLPKLATHAARLDFLRKAQKEGYQFDWSPFWSDDALLQKCCEVYWMMFEKIMKVKGVL